MFPRVRGHTPPLARKPSWVRLSCGLSLVAGLLLLVPATFYAYLNLHPPPVRPDGGDLYFGDGTGFVLASFFAVPAAIAFATGLVPWALWSRRSYDGAKVVAAVGVLVWGGVVALLVTFWFGLGG